MTAPEDHFPPEDCACAGFLCEPGCPSGGLGSERSVVAPRPYSLAFPHKQTRRSSAIRRLFDRRKITEDAAIELLRPISRMKDGCWAAPFDPKAVVGLWKSVLPLTYGPAERRT